MVSLAHCRGSRRACCTFLNPRVAIGLIVLLGSAVTLRAHDPMTSWTTVEIKAGVLEVRTNFYSTVAWNCVQETIDPELIFVLEDFDDVGRPVLQRFAATMQRVVVDGQPLSPSSVDVVVANDDFDFTLVYPLPAVVHAIQMEEHYLRLMTPGYVARIRVMNEQGESMQMETLGVEERSMEIRLADGVAVLAATTEVGTPASLNPPAAARRVLKPLRRPGTGQRLGSRSFPPR